MITVQLRRFNNHAFELGKARKTMRRITVRSAPDLRARRPLAGPDQRQDPLPAVTLENVDRLEAVAAGVHIEQGELTVEALEDGARMIGGCTYADSDPGYRSRWTGLRQGAILDS